MDRNLMGKALLSLALVAGGWLGGAAARGDTPTPTPTSQATQVAAPQKQVQSLLTWQASAGVFTADAQGNWAFSPPRGTVTISSSTNTTISGTPTLQIKGAAVIFKGGQHPVAAAGESQAITSGQQPAGIVNGSATILVP